MEKICLRKVGKEIWSHWTRQASCWWWRGGEKGEGEDNDREANWIINEGHTQQLRDRIMERMDPPVKVQLLLPHISGSGSILPEGSQVFSWGYQLDIVCKLCSSVVDVSVDPCTCSPSNMHRDVAVPERRLQMVEEVRLTTGCLMLFFRH